MPPQPLLFPTPWSVAFRDIIPQDYLTSSHAVWGMVRDRVVVQPASPPLLVTDWSSPVPSDHVRVVCISDTHNAHESLTLPPGDVLIHAGDFSDTGTEADITNFCSWLKKQTQFAHRIVIAGNHELSLCRESYERNWKRFRHPQRYSVDALEEELRSVCTYVNHNHVDVAGLRFFGSPYSPEFYDWGFNLQRGVDIRNAWGDMVAVQEERPIDVLITHGPPLGHGDVCDRQHVGCWDLLDFVERWPPALHVFGHIHEGYGVTTNGRTLFANASTLNERYDEHAIHAPIVVDVPLPNTDAAAQYRSRLAAAVMATDQ